MERTWQQIELGGKREEGVNNGWSSKPEIMRALKVP